MFCQNFMNLTNVGSNTNTIGTITWADGVTTSATILEKQGNIVYLSAFLDTITLPATWSVITLGTLPEGYRPKRSKYWMTGLQNASSAVRFSVTTAGQINLQNLGSYVGSSGYFGFNIAYPAE